MRLPFIKICGITRIQDAIFAEDCGADAVGVIGYPGSPRFISSKQAEQIFSRLGSKIIKVTVLVNPTSDEVISYAHAGADTIQLHGDENSKLVSSLPAYVKIWKAIRVQTKSDILQFNDFPAEKIVFEASVKGQYGGTGQKANWDLAKFAVANLNKPVILAGGIGIDNIHEALDIVQPFGLDINSSVEDSPGIKNHAKIKKIFLELENLGLKKTI